MFDIKDCDIPISFGEIKDGWCSFCFTKEYKDKYILCNSDIIKLFICKNTDMFRFSYTSDSFFQMCLYFNSILDGVGVECPYFDAEGWYYYMCINKDTINFYFDDIYYGKSCYNSEISFTISINYNILLLFKYFYNYIYGNKENLLNNWYYDDIIGFERLIKEVDKLYFNIISLENSSKLL